MANVFRGRRRVALLLASAFPLLANENEDIPARQHRIINATGNVSRRRSRSGRGGGSIQNNNNINNNQSHVACVSGYNSEDVGCRNPLTSRRNQTTSAVMARQARPTLSGTNLRNPRSRASNATTWEGSSKRPYNANFLLRRFTDEGGPLEYLDPEDNVAMWNEFHASAAVANRVSPFSNWELLLCFASEDEVGWDDMFFDRSRSNNMSPYSSVGHCVDDNFVDDHNPGPYYRVMPSISDVSQAFWWRKHSNRTHCILHPSFEQHSKRILVVDRMTKQDGVQLESKDTIRLESANSSSLVEGGNLTSFLTSQQIQCSHVVNASCSPSNGFLSCDLDSAHPRTNGTTQSVLYNPGLSRESTEGDEVTVFDLPRLNLTVAQGNASDVEFHDSRVVSPAIADVPTNWTIATNMTVINISEAVSFEQKDDQAGKQVKVDPSVERVVVDYASKSAGALILEKSSNFQGTSNLLNSDNDKYAIVPCREEAKFVVIGLSEEILVKKVLVSNYERYSSRFREFMVLGSTTMGEWADLGTFATHPGNGKQAFELLNPAWSRYLKFRFLSHHGDEHYCTISQISVHGSTMLQGFHEQWVDDAMENERENERLDHESDATGSFSNSSTESSEFEAIEELSVVVSPKDSQVDLRDSRDDGSHYSSTEVCVTKLNAVCPRDWDFERVMFLFESSGASDFDKLNALSSASICLSSSHFGAVSTNSSSSMRTLERNALVKPTSQGWRGTAKLVADSNENGSAVLAVLTDSPVVKKIQDLLKRSTGLDVEHLGHSLLRATAKEVDDPDGELYNLNAGRQPSDQKKDDDQHAMDGIASAPDLTSSILLPKSEPKDPKHEIAPASESVVEESMKETGMALAQALRRLPSASCLKNMDFADFKANSKPARNGSGGGGNASPGVSMEPIFKRLTDEIKLLQASVTAHDRFARESIACYQRVLYDLLIELEKIRSVHEARISRLEDLISRQGDWWGRLVKWYQISLTIFDEAIIMITNYVQDLWPEFENWIGENMNLIECGIV